MLPEFYYHTLQLQSHLYTVFLPPVCKLPRLTWIDWYCNLTVHTLLINDLYCIVHYRVCQISHEGYTISDNLFFFVLSTFTPTIQLGLLGCHFFSRLFLKHWNNYLMHGKYGIMHAWQKFWTSCVFLKHPVYSFEWLTSISSLNTALYCTIRTDLYSSLISCNKDSEEVMFLVYSVHCGLQQEKIIHIWLVVGWRSG